MTEYEWQCEDREIERQTEQREELEREDIIFDAVRNWARAQGLREVA